MSATKTPPTATAIPARERVTISMRFTQEQDNSYAVHLMVTGLISEQEAVTAMAHLQRLYCGNEISTS